jgi:hypothetical protein
MFQRCTHQPELKTTPARALVKATSRGLPDWSQKFAPAIPVQSREPLRTLCDAAQFIAALPKAEHDAEEWQAAMEALLLVAEHGGPIMLARIGVIRALHRNQPRSQSAQRRKHVKSFRIIR